MKCYVNNLIKKSKRFYFQESIDNKKGNPKGMWEALKFLTEAQRSNNITELKRENGTAETDTLAMVNMLNLFISL